MTGFPYDFPFTLGTETANTPRGRGTPVSFTKKQTGTPSKFGQRKSRKLINPWGKNVPMKFKRKSVVGRGQSTRKSTPDSQLFGMQYPKNKPSQWPVEIDFVNHTTQPSLSGYTSDVADTNNTAVNHAFKRAGYPEA